jgi:hypothetical protein
MGKGIGRNLRGKLDGVVEEARWIKSGHFGAVKNRTSGEI